MDDSTRSDAEELARLRHENACLTHELKEERERFQLTFDTSLVGYVVSSFELGKFQLVNQAYCDFLGYTREEILGTDPYKFWVQTTHADDLERERQQLQRLVSGESDRYQIQKRFLRKDGEIRWGEMSLRAALDAKGRVRYNVISCLDIHDQKVALAARVELE